VARSINEVPAAAERGRGRNDHAQTAFGERTPYAILASILGLVAAFALVFGLVSPSGEAIRNVDLAAAVMPVSRASTGRSTPPFRVRRGRRRLRRPSQLIIGFGL
jgi:hypothetical protein